MPLDMIVVIIAVWLAILGFLLAFLAGASRVSGTGDTLEEQSERRKARRHHPIYYLPVFDQASQSSLGHVADITTQGMRLISDKPVPTGRDFRLRLDIPHAEGGTHHDFASAHSVWRRRHVSADFYEVGLRLIDLPANTQRGIQDLIDGRSRRH